MRGAGEARKWRETRAWGAGGGSWRREWQKAWVVVRRRAAREEGGGVVGGLEFGIVAGVDRFVEVEICKVEICGLQDWRRADARILAPVGWSLLSMGVRWCRR